MGHGVFTDPRQASGGIPEVVRRGVDGEPWPLEGGKSAGEVLTGLRPDPARPTALARQAGDGAAVRFRGEEVAPGPLGLRDDPGRTHHRPRHRVTTVECATAKS
jgi:hypothetical protein